MIKREIRYKSKTAKIRKLYRKYVKTGVIQKNKKKNTKGNLIENV